MRYSLVNTVGCFLLFVLPCYNLLMLLYAKSDLSHFVPGASIWYSLVHAAVGYMVLPLGTFSPRVDGCNTPGRAQHLQLVDDAGGTAQHDEDEYDDKDEDAGFYRAPGWLQL